MKPTYFLLAATLCAAALPAGAQSGASTPSITPNSPVPVPQSLKLGKDAQPGAVLTDKAAYKRGQPVRLTFRVTNTSDKPVRYQFPSGQRFDAFVKNEAGAEIWKWSEGRMFAQSLRAVSLPPGKSLVYTAVWNGRDRAGRPAPSGKYTVSANLTTENRPAITGGVALDTSRDPNNMSIPTKTPAELGHVRPISAAPQVSAEKTVMIR